MNFEFIPCVLKHTEGSPVYGLLIRPVNGASGTGVQNPNISPQVPAVPVQGRATSSGDILQIPRSSTQLHLVPSQQPTPILPAVSGNKVLLPPNTNLTTVASPTTNYQFGVHGHGNKPQVPSAAPCLLSPPIHPVEFGQHKSGFNSPAFVSAASGVPTTMHQHYEQSRPETQSVQVVPQMASSSKGGYHGLETPPAGHHPQHQPVMTNFQSEGMSSSTASRPCFPPQQNSHSANERGGYFHGQQPVTGGGGGSVELTSLLEDIDTRDLAEFGRILAESESILSTDALLDGSVSEASLPNADRSHSSQYNNYDSASTNFSHANSYSSNFHSVVPLPSSAAPTPTAVRQPCRFQGEQRPVGEKSHNVNLGAPRPQLDWERAPAETAGTPDSGIQSITGSPHGAGQSPNLSPLMRHSTHFAGCYSLHSRLQNPLPQSGEKSNVNLVSDIQKLPATVSDKDVDSAKKLKIDKIRKGNTNRGEITENSSKNKEKKCGEFADMPTLVPELSAESSSADSESGNKRKRKHEPSAIADGDSAVNLASVDVNICDKVSCMDEKFNKVCLQVLKGEKPVESLGNWKPSEGDFPRSPFQESHPNSADRSALVDKLLSTLQPDQLQLFSRLFDAAKLKKSVVVEKKMKKQNGKKSKRSVSRGSDVNRNKSDISSAEPEENLSGYLSDTSSSISTPSENRSASPASSFAPPTPSVEQGTNKFSADLSKDAVLQDLSASQERCKESASDQKGPHTVSLREKRMLMKLKEFRSRARNIIDPSLIEHVLDLAAKLQNLQLSDTDTARVKKIGDPCFRVRWERIKLRKERLERLQHCEKMKSFDNLRNLEKEAESSDEESGEPVTKVDGETEREKMVEIKDSPERGTISLRIRLGALCPKVSEALLPPKKRIKQQQNQNILSEDAKPKSSSVELTPADANLDDEKDKNKSKVPDAGTQNQTKVKKRRRNRLYPWDRVRQRRKQRLIDRGVFRRCKLCKAWLRIQDFLERDAETGEKSRLCSNCTQSLHLEQTEVSKPPAELKPADQMKQCRVILRKLPSKIGKNRRESSTDDSSGIELDGDKTYSKPRKKYRRPGEVGDTLSRKESSDMGSACDEVNLPNKYFNGAFRLPYDLWWDFYYYPRNPSSNFTLTRSNINVDQPPKSTQPNVCTCRIPEVEGAGACVDNCLNRMMFTECRSGWCPCGDVCQNQRFQKHQWIKGLKKFDTNTERGCGVNTEHEIFKGTFICEYIGEIVSVERFSERMQTLYKNCVHHYALHLTSGFLIDSYRCGSVARFVNHSCQPNCEMQKWCVNGSYRVGLFALRDIEAGEELTYDYKFHAFRNQQKCLCGSSNCRGTIGNASSSAGTSASVRKPDIKRPVSQRQRSLVSGRRIFLFRNIERVRRKTVEKGFGDPDEKPKLDVKEFILALKNSRTLRTRRFAGVSENEPLLRIAQLAQVLNTIFSTVLNCSNRNGVRASEIFAKDEQCEKIRSQILSGSYKDPRSFDEEMGLFLLHVGKTYGKELGGCLTDTYKSVKTESVEQLEGVLGFQLPTSFLTTSVVKKQLNNVTSKNSELITTAADLSYMKGEIVVGSYDSDDPAGVWSERADRAYPHSDLVRCICGIYEEEGLMLQCEKCLYWQHGDCVKVSGDQDCYSCYYCLEKTERVPPVDVVQFPQPDVRLPGCTYYRALTNCSNMQIRQGECVYVERIDDEAHKEILKQLDESCIEKPSAQESGTKSSKISANSPKAIRITKKQRNHYCRTDLRILRVERLFTGPNGRKFVFGFYYARPHETFCEPTRKFYKNELFCTPLYNTLPLDAVVARCLVMESQTFCKGRPSLPSYHEDDVYICDLRVDKTQRFFEKIGQKNRYPVCTEPYIFRQFPTRQKIKRDFSPFIFPPEKHRWTSEKSKTLDVTDEDIPLDVIKNRILSRKKDEKRTRLETLVGKILSRHTR